MPVQRESRYLSAMDIGKTIQLVQLPSVRGRLEGLSVSSYCVPDSTGAQYYPEQVVLDLSGRTYRLSPNEVVEVTGRAPDPQEMSGN